MTTEPVRLTSLASCAGCAAKAGAEAVAQVLELLTDLRPDDDPNLLVGLQAPDDAAVYRLNDEQAVVMTTDFFMPLVDDPYDFGAIAAANAMSDVYAMGGEVTLALNIAGFPEDLPRETIAAVLRGGAEKVHQAGGIVGGGHTIIDAEPKYGLCVLGLVHPDRILTKGGARPGDVLFLTKPLGTGILTTAAMRDRADPEHLAVAVASMTRLNRHASHLAREAGEVRALTDVTGFGILGHGYEIASASGAALRFDTSLLPLLPGALEYAGQGITTGGANRNRKYLDGKVRVGQGVSAAVEHVLFDPQTSGGLLFAVAPEAAPDVEAQFAASGEPLWRVGEVQSGEGVEAV
jgi:selenide,water dikinase